MTKVYTALVMAGMVALSNSAFASGVPVYSSGEVTNMSVDNYKSDDVRKLVELQKDLVHTTLDATGGPSTFSASSMKSNLSKNLTEPSDAVGTYDGLATILGAKSEYGEIKVKKCGGNADEVMTRLSETVAYPPKAKDRLDMSETKKAKVEKERATSIERNATTSLAEAWVVQAETAEVAETLKKTQEELDKAQSQMAVLATLLRLQEETQKNLNTRLSIMSDDMINTGLVALDGNI